MVRDGFSPGFTTNTTVPNHFATIDGESILLSYSFPDGNTSLSFDNIWWPNTRAAGVTATITFTIDGDENTTHFLNLQLSARNNQPQSPENLNSLLQSLRASNSYLPTVRNTTMKAYEISYPCTFHYSLNVSYSNNRVDTDDGTEFIAFQ